MSPHFEDRLRELNDWISRDGRVPRDRAEGAGVWEHLMRIRYVIMTSAGAEIGS